MGEALKLCYVVRKHTLSNGHLCLPNIHTNTKSDESIKVGGKKHHFGHSHGNKEPKYHEVWASGYFYHNTSIKNGLGALKSRIFGT